MTDLQVVAVITAKPGSEEIVRDALTTLAGHTLGEAGCQAYALFESEAAPGTFVTTETWLAQADLDAHLRTDHLQAALATTDGHLAAPPAIHPLRPISG
ncbi:putative quinol monooxygenase [Amycolatopsis sp. H20-H5]|uniref:putative quinol monooxygenase n=1 Tax=Amycolatopsis sp. H20-H5 TaxID=3046309 RepID=UPI002DBD095A|nr:putative quinol monooxygenase [Amycolatopsis sp. H20-H5]MEC3978253.1 putative quinol monooxygenase [Amycolatopsis sp. H20-H5]